MFGYKVNRLEQVEKMLKMRCLLSKENIEAANKIYAHRVNISARSKGKVVALEIVESTQPLKPVAA